MLIHEDRVADGVDDDEALRPLRRFVRPLQWLYRTWPPRSGFAPDHQPAFEAWLGAPYAHGLDHFELKIQLAVVDAEDKSRL